MNTVKDMLKSGIAPEELMANLQKEIADAQAELSGETANIDEVRADLVDAMLDYVVALGLIKENDINDEDVEMLTEMLKNAEEEMMAQVKFLTMMKNVLGKSMEIKKTETAPVKEPQIDSDAILRNFLRGLK